MMLVSGRQATTYVDETRIFSSFPFETKRFYSNVAQIGQHALSFDIDLFGDDVDEFHRMTQERNVDIFDVPEERQRVLFAILRVENSSNDFLFGH